MYKFVLSVLLILSVPVVTLRAQADKNPLINSGKLLEDAQKLYEDGKYKDAIQLYAQIPRSDTNYSVALRNLASVTYSDSDFVASSKYAFQGLKLFPEEAYDWYNLIGNAYEAQKNTDSALAYYNRLIAINPYTVLGWYNKGIAYYDAKNYPEAKNCLQKAILVNPYYSSAHYYLGKAYLEEGNLPAAMLCLTTSLAVNPDNNRKRGAVTLLTTIAHVSDEVAERAANAHFGRTDNFEMQQEILTSKAALEKAYKLQTDLEDPITRQMQVLFEKLEYNAADTGFCMQFYVPFYRSVFQQGKFSQLSYFIFTGFDIKIVQEYAKKHKKDLEDFVEYEVAYYNPIRETHLLNPDAQKNVTVRYWVENEIVTGRGAWKDNGKDKLFYGPWEFYYTGGRLKSKGVFNDAEDKEGEWVFYYKNGQLKERSNLTGGKLNGKSTHWFDNGNISYEVNYVNDKEEGEERTYYYNGLLHEITQYKDGKKEGLLKGYTSRGQLSYDAYYKNDEQDGAEIYYYASGKILSQAQYSAGKADGQYKKFAENGTVIMQGSYVQDKPDGAWKNWYPSGKLKEEYTYQNGNLAGEYKSYFENGQLSQHSNYTEGKEDGILQAFNEDGKLVSESNYERGRLRELKFLDAKGNVLIDNTTRNGAGTFTFYDAYGNRTSTGDFNKDGESDGTKTDYYQDGVVSSTEENKKGLLNGVKTTYFHNGNISDQLNYTDDKEDGYYTSYYNNKKPRYEGWFVEGEKQGTFIEYNLMGNLHSKSYYKDDEQSGYTEYYNPDGTKDYEDLYDEGWLTHTTQFDTTGKVLADVALPKGNGDVVFYYNCAKPYIKTHYSNYHLDGKQEAFYPDGTPLYVRFYKQGLQDSIYKQYYYGGTLETDGRFSGGKKEGVWKMYHDNGKLHYDETYVNDMLEGKSTFYNDDGTKNREYFYKDNQFNGNVIFYGDSNKVAIQFTYHEGRLMNYTYEGKDGKLVAAIPFTNETGNAVAYYRNGVKSADMSFVNGYTNSMRTIYYSNGKVFIDGQCSYGDYEGPHKRYTVTGQVVADENYVDDNLHGLAKYYYPNGNLKAEVNYYNGNENGVCKYYDEAGKLKQTRFYYYGQLENVK